MALPLLRQYMLNDTKTMTLLGKEVRILSAKLIEKNSLKRKNAKIKKGGIYHETFWD